MKVKLKIPIPKFLQRLNRIEKLHKACYLAAMVVMAALSGWCIHRLRLTENMRKDFEFIFRSLEEDLESSVLERKGDGCVMPQLDPFNAEVMGFERALPTVACTGQDWVECYMDKCFVTKSVRNDLKNLSCVYRDIMYVNKLRHYLGSPTKLGAKQKYTLKKSDHVKVSCLGTSRLRPEPPLYWSGHKSGLRQVFLHKRPSHGPRFSVMMLCLDSMSKNTFIRLMPKSFATLKKMGAYILNGYLTYNVVGDGAVATLFPIFTGNLSQSNKIFTEDFLDDGSCIFSRLYRKGYRTAYFGEALVLGSLEDTLSWSSRQPADHYLPSLLQEQYGNQSRPSTRSLCIGDTPLYGLLLNLTHQFSKLNGHRFSFTFISDTGRDDLSIIPAADEDLALFLRRIRRGGKLKETVVFVMGDHGPRISSVRGSVQGKLENRLPLMAIVLPERLKQSRPDAVAAMRANVDVLTTPFDIHSTLTDIFGIREHRNRYKVPGADMERGLSLLQPAGVLPHWCACAAWQPLSPEDPMYSEIGNVVVDYINSMTMILRLTCMARELVSVEQVLHLSPSPNEKIVKNKVVNDVYLGQVGGWVLPRSSYYQAKVIMDPGRAVFEATLRYFVKGDYFAITDEDISRLNPYRNESACLKSRFRYLHKFCYCI